jgi:hypothetical protein
MGAGLDALVRDLIMVQDAGCRRVGLLRSVFDEFTRLEERWQSRLKRCFHQYGVPGARLPPEQFRAEGRSPLGRPGAGDVQVFVFKAFQCRIYGVTVQMNGVHTFVGMEMAIKKTDRADEALLRRVAQNSRRFWE